jgi:ABC-type Zn2+ transport system substrate-binding protein/surface adhesin
MCKDCGCSLTDSAHTHNHDHDHSHEHQKAHEHLHHNPQLNDAKTISVIQKILDGLGLHLGMLLEGWQPPETTEPEEENGAKEGDE